MKQSRASRTPVGYIVAFCSAQIDWSTLKKFSNRVYVIVLCMQIVP